MATEKDLLESLLFRQRPLQFKFHLLESLSVPGIDCSIFSVTKLAFENKRKNATGERKLILGKPRFAADFIFKNRLLFIHVNPAQSIFLMQNFYKILPTKCESLNKYWNIV